MSALLLLWLALSGGPLPGRVHADLESSVPAADATVPGEVREIRLVFTEAVQLALTTVVLTGPAGAVEGSSIELVRERDGREVVVRLAAPLPNGAWALDWRTAAADGHPSAGKLAFRVDAPLPVDTPHAAAAPPPAPEPPNTPATRLPVFLPALVRWLLYVATTGMIGVATFRWAV
ncbi:MAG: copper resistance protein CopC, partial [Gemmatimonadetes bacterium]|nr:copper resistance protein CopC [Gemmatimonadota bacterium]